MRNTFIKMDFKWVLSSQKLNDLKTGKQLLLEKDLCKTQDGDWVLKLLRKNEANSVSYSLVVERINSTTFYPHIIKMRINLYTLKPKLHLLQKSIVERIRGRYIVDLSLGSPIQEIIQNNTGSIISGNFFMKDKFHPKISETLAETITKSTDALSNDLSMFCCSGFASDVVLKCNSGMFTAHKIILTARSPYFAELFRNSEKSQVDINDLKPDILKALLFFIYSAKIEKLTPELAFDLLTASITYKLQDLKAICVNYLISVMSVENVIPMHVFAVETDEELKIHTLKYMSGNFKLLESSNGWQKLLKEKPEMATQILTGIVKSID